MGYANLGQCVRELATQGQLVIVDAPIDPYLEMAAIQRRAFAAKSPAILFTRPKNCRFPMLANLFGTRERIAYIFRDSLEDIKKIFKLKTNPKELFKSPAKSLGALLKLLKMPPIAYHNPESARNLPVLEESCSLADLPHLVSWPHDGGAFITLPIVQTENSARKTNLGMYRVQISGNNYSANEAGMHYQLERGIGVHHAEALAAGHELPVHIYVGGPPALTLAAIMPLPPNISELLFAGLLGGHRILVQPRYGFELPVIGECDFLLQGTIGKEVAPEGPFGDHLGYYSLKHDFPVVKIKKVWHRKDAIWPFTSVGRPPQEDTMFGEIIHELTAPLAGDVFNGVKAIHAVDAAGVHPLLLAVGSERYTPTSPERKPRELLRQALHLLGATQTSLAKYLLICADDQGVPDIYNTREFFAYLLERTDFSRDLHFFTRTTSDTLDYSGSGLNEGSKLVWAAHGPKLRSLGREIGELPDSGTFFRPRLVAPGILAISGPPHTLGVSQQDPAINDLALRLKDWPNREAFPLLVISDDSDFCAASWDNFLWITFTRSDPATDTYGIHEGITAKHWHCEAPLIIDARTKKFHAPPVEDDPEVIKRIEALAVQGGPLAGLI